MLSLSLTAEGEYEVATSVTSRLEGMRKMGGDKWLSLLNTDKSRHTVVSHDTVSCSSDTCSVYRTVYTVVHYYNNMCLKCSAC